MYVPFLFLSNIKFFDFLKKKKVRLGSVLQTNIKMVLREIVTILVIPVILQSVIFEYNLNQAGGLFVYICLRFCVMRIITNLYEELKRRPKEKKKDEVHRTLKIVRQDPQPYRYAKIKYYDHPILG